MIKKLVFALCALAVTAAVSSAVAQEAVLEQFYGSGVHRYFANDYSRAEADLSSAIGGGSKDPRAYYFRALAKLRSGQDATADLQRAAALEVADVNQSYPVGKSLERVQGSTRATIERYRALARATAMTRQQRRDADRYNQLEQAETKVLRGPAPATRASAIEPAPVAPKAAPNVAVPASPAAEDPFAEPAAPVAAAPGPAAPAAPKPPVPEPPVPVDDPFGDDTTKPAAADAAGPADEMPADEPPAEAPAPAAKSEGDDPFGEPPAKEEAGEMPEEPAAPAAAEPAAGETEDPFADPK